MPAITAGGKLYTRSIWGGGNGEVLNFDVGCNNIHQFLPRVLKYLYISLPTMKFQSEFKLRCPEAESDQGPNLKG